MAEFYDPQRSLTENWRDYFYDRRKEMFILPCKEGDVELQGNWMLLNIMLCQPLIKRARPISRNNHLLTSGIYGSEVHAQVLTRIRRTLEEYGYARDDLSPDLIQTVEDAHNMCYTHLGSHIRTMDIFAIAETMLQPVVKEVCTMDYGDINDGDIHRMEKAFQEQSKKVDVVLCGDELEFNIFRAPLLCNGLKKTQFWQSCLSAGPRTDTDDGLFLRPVRGSFISGMCDILDLTIESRSASKSTHYNKTQMSTTQYNNRKIHLLNSSQRYLYDGDCGSTLYMEYTPNKNTVERYLGKFYLNDNKELTELTVDRFEEVIGKTLQMRDPPVCLYTDGYCEVCGGTITKSFARNGNVGFLSNVNTGAPVAQQVLSSKHLSTTNAAKYEIPPELADLLVSTGSDVFLSDNLFGAAPILAFGFQPNDISKINDLKHYILNHEFNAAYFTEIKYMSIGQVKADGTIQKHVNRTSMKSENETYPHLSPEVLDVIRDHPTDIVMQDGIAWFLLRHINPERPIMQCAVVNNSVRRFVKRFTDLVMKDVESFTSINHFVRVLTDMIWNDGKVPTHITHVSCLARSCLITSKHNYHVPVVTDPENVMFGSLNKIIPSRSIGALLAYQNINQAIQNPVTYIQPKQDGIYDAYMGYSDQVRDQMNYPVMTDSHIEIEPLEAAYE